MIRNFNMTSKPFNALWNIILFREHPFATRLTEDMLRHVRTVEKGLLGTSLSCCTGKLCIASANINAVLVRECLTEETVLKDTNDSCTKAMSYGDYQSTMILGIDPLSGPLAAEKKRVWKCHSSKKMSTLHWACVETQTLEIGPFKKSQWNLVALLWMQTFGWCCWTLPLPTTSCQWTRPPTWHSCHEMNSSLTKYWEDRMGDLIPPWKELQRGRLQQGGTYVRYVDWVSVRSVTWQGTCAFIQKKHLYVTCVPNHSAEETS